VHTHLEAAAHACEYSYSYFVQPGKQIERMRAQIIPAVNLISAAIFIHFYRAQPTKSFASLSVYTPLFFRCKLRRRTTMSDRNCRRRESFVTIRDDDDGVVGDCCTLQAEERRVLVFCTMMRSLKCILYTLTPLLSPTIHKIREGIYTRLEESWLKLRGLPAAH
jgi:hypothetical protein